MPEKFVPNPKEIPENIVPVQREEDKKPSIFDIEGGLEILDRIENGEENDEEKKPTLQ